MLTRDSIFQADDLPRREVEVPEWGGSLFVRMMSGAERVAFENMVMGGNIREVDIVILCAVDASGERMFREEDADALLLKNSRVLHRIASAALKVNVLTDEAATEAGND